MQSRADFRPLRAGGKTGGGRHGDLRDSWDSRRHHLGIATTTARIGSVQRTKSIRYDILHVANIVSGVPGPSSTSNPPPAPLSGPCDRAPRHVIAEGLTARGMLFLDDSPSPPP